MEIVVGAAVAFAVFALAFVAWWAAWRRALARRLGVLAARLGDDEVALTGGEGVEGLLGALEQAGPLSSDALAR